IADLFGIEPRVGEKPEPEQFYWSGVVPLGHGRFLEILGPNPDWQGSHPMIDVIRHFDEPQPLFWYVATQSIAEFASSANALGAPLEMQQTFHHEREGVSVSYTNAVIGPGFRSTRPCVIEWHSRSEWMDDAPQVTLDRFELVSPIASQLNTLFRELGIRQEVKEGPEAMTLVLGTPKGEVEFSAPGFVVEEIPMPAAEA
ncbi:MAG: VOC family protein, partial [Pseudomonadota bacterium]